MAKPCLTNRGDVRLFAPLPLDGFAATIREPTQTLLIFVSYGAFITDLHTQKQNYVFYPHVACARFEQLHELASLATNDDELPLVPRPVEGRREQVPCS